LILFDFSCIFCPALLHPVLGMMARGAGIPGKKYLKAITCLPQNQHFVVSKDEWDTKEGPEEHNYLGLPETFLSLLSILYSQGHHGISGSTRNPRMSAILQLNQDTMLGHPRALCLGYPATSSNQVGISWDVNQILN